MEMRRLGDTGVRVSAFALGAMSFGSLGNTDHDVVAIHNTHIRSFFTESNDQFQLGNTDSNIITISDTHFRSVLTKSND